MPNRSLRIDLSADVAPAAYFLVASWPNPETCPRLDTVERPLKLLIDPSATALGDLRATLRLMSEAQPNLKPSAAALVAAVDRQLGDLGSN